MEPAYNPTAEEIREACRAIQSEWTPEEETKRRVVKDREWEAPEVRVDPS